MLGLCADLASSVIEPDNSSISIPMDWSLRSSESFIAFLNNYNAAPQAVLQWKPIELLSAISGFFNLYEMGYVKKAPNVYFHRLKLSIGPHQFVFAMHCHQFHFCLGVGGKVVRTLSACSVARNEDLTISSSQDNAAVSMQVAVMELVNGNGNDVTDVQKPD